MQPMDTARLRLRVPEATDVRPLRDIHEDPDVVKTLTVVSPLSGLTVAWRNVALLIGHWQIRGYGEWTVIERHTGEVIGRVGLSYPDGWPGVELGWVIRKNRWGQGYATEAARAALQWAWDHTDIEHIISMIQPDNRASVRIAEKIGERFERADTVRGEEVLTYGIHKPRVATKGFAS
jgi:RimJ/RimL family protein N-acetyltransferase